MFGLCSAQNLLNNSNVISHKIHQDGMKSLKNRYMTHPKGIQCIHVYIPVNHSFYVAKHSDTFLRCVLAEQKYFLVIAKLAAYCYLANTHMRKMSRVQTTKWINYRQMPFGFGCVIELC